MTNKKIAIAKPTRRVIASLALGLVAVGLWGKHVFVGTPRYSLGQLQQAIEAKDTEKTAKYVDTEAIASQIVDVSLNFAQQQAIAQNGIFGMLGNSLGLAEMIRPQMQTQMEQVLDRALQQIPNDNGLEEIKLDSIERNQQQATATFQIADEADKDFPLKSLTMTLEQQPNRQWQITGLSKESLKSVAEAMDNL